MIILVQPSNADVGKNEVLGAAQRMGWELAEQLTKRNIPVVLIAKNNKRESFEEPFKFIGIPETEFCHAVKQYKGIIHQNGLNLLYETSCANLPSILSLHLRPSIVHMADGSNICYKIFVSDYILRRWVIERPNAPIGRFKVIHNSLDMSLFEQQEEKEDFILYVGATVRPKGIWEFIRIAKEMSHLNFKIIGSGRVWRESDDIFLNAIRGINNLEYLGELPYRKTISFMKKALLGIVPSHCGEASPIPPLEFQASRTPVIASNDGGITENITDGIGGYVIPITDWSCETFPVEKFIEKIQYLIDNPEERKKMGNEGYDWVQRFSWVNNLPKYLEVYDEVEKG